jgi:hypothetical protein
MQHRQRHVILSTVDMIIMNGNIDVYCTDNCICADIVTRIMTLVRHNLAAGHHHHIQSRVNTMKHDIHRNDIRLHVLGRG